MLEPYIHAVLAIARIDVNTNTVAKVC